MFSTPEVSGDKLFIGSCSGRFYALDVSTGSPVWDYDITMDGDQTSFHGDMLITGDAILIGTDDGEGHIYSFDAKSGRANWKFPAGRGASSDIVVSGNWAFGVTLDDRLVCLDLKSGQLQWQLESGANTGEHINTGSTPVVVGDVVYYGAQNGFIYALSVYTGEAIWNTPVPGRVITSTLHVKNALIVGTDYSEIHRLNLKTGELENTLSVDYPVRGHFVPTPEGIIVAFIADSDWEGELIGFDADLNLKWGTSVPDGSTFVSARPYLMDRWILAGTGTGLFYAIDAASGVVGWSHAVDPDRDWAGTGDGVRVFGGHDSLLFVGTVSGAVYALDLQILRYQWSTEEKKD